MSGNQPKPELHKKKVLVIEDEPDLRQLSVWLLEAEGYQAFQAADGTEGLKIAMENSPDLILLDIKMPGRYGWSILTEIKVTPELRHIPVIILTASADAGNKSKAIQMGAVDFLIKPIDAEKLRGYIRSILAGTDSK
jgi:DNA-binding response OmpR family regulator